MCIERLGKFEAFDLSTGKLFPCSQNSQASSQRPK